MGSYFFFYLGVGLLYLSLGALLACASFTPRPDVLPYTLDPKA